MKAGKFVVAILLGALAGAASAQVPTGLTPDQWQSAQLAAAAKSEQIMDRAEKLKGLLAQYQSMRGAYLEDKGLAFHLIFGQYFSWYQSFVGDYPDAEQSFSIQQTVQTGDAPSPLVDPGYSAQPALTAIPKLAKDRRVVFLNEAHNIGLTRTLTVQLLKALRDEGFNTFAAETLYQTDTGLQARGYPTGDSGFYTEEPIYAEMVRTALKLGYKVYAYEATGDVAADAREAEQARNLVAILKRDPNARLVVNAGYAHIQKSGGFLGGRSMAEHFIADTGIVPLSVEQTVLIPHSDAGMDHPYWRAVIDALHPAQPIVFLDADGKPWTLRKGYDVSVFFPAQVLRRGRPTWLTLGGLRVPYFVSGDLCADKYPCLVEARYADEGDDAIPADRLVLDPIPLNPSLEQRIISSAQGAPTGELYLRPGRYRLSATASDNHVIMQQAIVVGTKGAQP